MAVSTANFWAAILSFSFPRLLSTWGTAGSFEFYALLNIVALVLVFLFVPETRMKTLEELDGVFSVSTRAAIKYQTREWLPWFWRRYMLMDKSAELREMEGDGVDGGSYRRVEQEQD